MYLLKRAFYIDQGIFGKSWKFSSRVDNDLNIENVLIICRFHEFL